MRDKILKLIKNLTQKSIKQWFYILFIFYKIICLFELKKKVIYIIYTYLFFIN